MLANVCILVAIIVLCVKKHCMQYNILLLLIVTGLRTDLYISSMLCSGSSVKVSYAEYCPQVKVYVVRMSSLCSGIGRV